MTDLLCGGECGEPDTNRSVTRQDNFRRCSEMKPGGSVESSCCGWELSLGGKVATEIWDLAEEFYLN